MAAWWAPSWCRWPNWAARVDVVVTLSGIFRDLLPMQTRMLAEAALLAASADEPLTANFVRKHTWPTRRSTIAILKRPRCASFQRRRGLWRQRQPDDRRRRVDRARGTGNAFETHKAMPMASRGRRWLARMQRAARCRFRLQNLKASKSASPISINTSMAWVGQPLGGAGQGQEAGVYILDATQGAAKVRTLAEQIDLKPAPARSIPSGSRHAAPWL
jgi:magnesium chelatase subunit H